MLGHAETCRCFNCLAIRHNSVPIEQIDRDVLANMWELWVSRSDGEASKLRAGHDGNPGSSRFVALQAIARTRLRFEG